MRTDSYYFYGANIYCVLLMIKSPFHRNLFLLYGCVPLIRDFILLVLLWMLLLETWSSFYQHIENHDYE